MPPSSRIGPANRPTSHEWARLRADAGMSLFRKSIGAPLLFSVFAMSLIIAAQGYYGYSVLSTAGQMVVDTLDRPLFGVNNAPAANFDFAQIERKMLQRAAAQPKARAADARDIAALAAISRDDLGVAEERSDEA